MTHTTVQRTRTTQGISLDYSCCISADHYNLPCTWFHCYSEWQYPSSSLEQKDILHLHDVPVSELIYLLVHGKFRCWLLQASSTCVVSDSATNEMLQKLLQKLNDCQRGSHIRWILDLPLHPDLGGWWWWAQWTWVLLLNEIKRLEIEKNKLGRVTCDQLHLIMGLIPILPHDLYGHLRWEQYKIIRMLVSTSHFSSERFSFSTLADVHVLHVPSAGTV